MTLDIDRILRETFVAKAEYHPSIGSTNDRAMECAVEDGRKMPLLVAAACQTAGRGRGSNRWWTGEGSLALSLLLSGETVSAGVRRSPLVSLATAVAIVETVAPLIPGHHVGIHWPNDVFVGEGKLAGILIEVLPDGRHVVGIGLNANNASTDAPTELRRPVATLRELRAQACDLTEITIDLLRQLQHQFARLGRQPEGVSARADALCLQRGRVLTLQHGSRLVSGRCRGIAADGALMLETPAGTEAFYSGTFSGCDVA